jgi:alpha-tubulin suppressor-like RCC1 family protein
VSRAELLHFPARGGREIPIVKIVAGCETFMAVDEEGGAYMWGQVIGTRGTQHSFVPLLIETMHGEHVVDAALGLQHALLLTKAGRAFSFGLGPGTTYGFRTNICAGTHMRRLRLFFLHIRSEQGPRGSCFSTSVSLGVSGVSPSEENRGV